MSFPPMKMKLCDLKQGSLSDRLHSGQINEVEAKFVLFWSHFVFKVNFLSKKKLRFQDCDFCPSEMSIGKYHCFLKQTFHVMRYGGKAAAAGLSEIKIGSWGSIMNQSMQITMETKSGNYYVIG